MNRSRSKAIQRFLELKSIREEQPASLMKRIKPAAEADSFFRQSWKTGAEALWIQSAEFMAGRFGDERREELRWLLLYLLELSSRGHIRISMEDIEKDFPLWAAEAYGSASEMAENLPGLIGANPRLFGKLMTGEAGLKSAPILYAPDFSYFYLLKKQRFEADFLKVLGTFTDREFQVPEDLEREAALEEIYNSLKDSAPMPLSEDTVNAARILNRSRLSIITGGPGTGKTTILSGLLKIYLETFFTCPAENGALPEVRLCAPTGRASKRMMESMDTLLQDEKLKGAFIHPAQTIHKVLGLRPGAPASFNERRKLHADILVVDEASMVDLNLMTMILKALKPTARLLLVGDRDQLPSVESGALLSDLLYRVESDSQRLNGRVVSLTKVHRNSGAILDASRLVISENHRDFASFLDDPGRKVPLDEALRNGAGWVKSGSLPGYRALLDELTGLLKNLGAPSSSFSVSSKEWRVRIDEIDAAFDLYRNLSVLSPTKKGLYGTRMINRGISELVSPKSPDAYHGRPVIVTRNDYDRGLYNGDRGVVFQFSDGNFACFEDAGDRYRLIPLPLLTDIETAYAVTIHKSQGSEFRYVYVLVPEGSDRLLSREILYTGITRAREGVILYGERSELETCLSRGVRRLSGIRDFMIQT